MVMAKTDGCIINAFLNLGVDMTVWCLLLAVPIRQLIIFL